ncbi:MAG: pyrroline-5-carboxylate reductase [Mariprofundaceae bacterium]|nr:pyrroline-5-carboxylate reductase [Mariprofundaceae bacterium]
MKQQKVTFIGGGNMSEALFSGLLKSGHAAAKITVADVEEERLQALHEQYAVQTSLDNVEAIQHADVVVLAVKPQQIEAVLKAISPSLTSETTLVSIAAGLGIEKMCGFAQRDDLSFVRVMPNTPALLGAGMSVLFSDAGQEHQDRAEYILAASGKTAWVDQERLLHAVTAVSGSGPAYFFLLAEMMAAAGESHGLSKELAAQLASQTALGAGRMLVESGRDAATLRSQVTSPGGTTQAALDKMYERDLPTAIRQGVQAAFKRSKALA